jgi:hypothetical protein
MKGNWLAAAYPSALAAASALYVARTGRARGVARAGVGLAALVAAYVHLVPLVPWLPFPARDETSAGWHELAARAEKDLAALPAGAFVAGCNYKVSAELAYYLPGRPETRSVELMGDNGLQFGVDVRPGAWVGREALLVLDEREKNTCVRCAEACAPLEPLEPLTVKRGKSVVTTFRFWRCRYAGVPGAPVAAAPPGR